MNRNESGRDKLIRCLDYPTSQAGIAFNLVLLGLIYLSVALLVLEMRNPKLAEGHRETITAVNLVILGLFTIELIGRLIVYRWRVQYLTSVQGIVDLLAIVPGLLALGLPFAANASWLRVLRIVRVLRFMRLAKFANNRSRIGAILGGVLQRLIPWIALAGGIKGVLLAAEAMPWWPEVGDLGPVITVVGFAISILLGAKLSIVHNRFYEVEDAICRILGAVTDMKKTEETRSALNNWTASLKGTIEIDTDERYREFKRETRELEAVLEKNGVGGPVTAGFHKDVEFLIHRLRTRTPPFLEKFLRYVTVTYAGIAILAIPGFTGFFSAVLIVFVLGGMYLLVDDLDIPLVKEGRSLFSIDLTPINEYGQSADGESDPSQKAESLREALA